MRVIKREAFSLVELLLVVVIMGILGALILLNMSTSERIDAQTEAKRFVRSLHSLRSAWIAYNADKYTFLGVPNYDPTDAAQVTAVQRSLEIYANRADFAADVRRYGKINIITDPVNDAYSRIYLGFDGTGDFGGDADKKDAVMDILEGDFGKSYQIMASFDSLMLRVW
ncbi:MAG: prepilin-type N-terminal cleavage/methylation domain-containing protein [Synergistaceae bacterium]|jgi:prepilin-type N-terminal cleavage/methylation domain-containing protein|nr:prepilin-type N-terminal cleavage/methylation domain-containing protein [Synergistaceae bacterium]